MEVRTVRRTLTLSLAAGALALGFSFGTMQAAPAASGLESMKLLAPQSRGTVEKVQWGRSCWERCRARGESYRVCRERCSGGGWGGEGCYERCRERGHPRFVCRERCSGSGWGREGCYERCRERGQSRLVCRQRCSRD
jgi:hypothetical protein